MRSALIAALLFVPALASAQTTVYTNNFESGLGTGWSGGGSVQSSGGLSAFGFGNNHLRNDGTSASILSLSGLASHTSMTVQFSLAMWDSIDWGDDAFQFFVGAVPVFNATFGNYGTPSGQCQGPGTVLTPNFIDFNTTNYGYGGYRDCARDVSFTFGHTASAESFSWTYFISQGGLDESFGIDNLRITTNAVPSNNGGPTNTVPEPGTYALLLAGLGAIGLAHRRRRAA